MISVLAMIGEMITFQFYSIEAAALGTAGLVGIGMRYRFCDQFRDTAKKFVIVCDYHLLHIDKDRDILLAQSAIKDLIEDGTLTGATLTAKDQYDTALRRS